MINYLEECKKRIRSYSERENISPKKIALKFIFWNIKYIFSHNKSKKSLFEDDVFHIIIHPKGGIGDLAYAAKYIYCLKKKFHKNISIDVFTEKYIEAANVFWKNQPHINDVIYDKNNLYHDCQIEIVRFPVVKHIDKKRLANVGSNELKEYFKIIRDFYIKNPLFFLSDHLGKEYSKIKGKSRENQADIEDMLNMSETNNFHINIPKNNDFLKKHGLITDQYIILQTGSGIHFKNEKDMRQWPLEYYNELTKKIKSINKSIQIIQIGESSQKPILKTDLNLTGKTSFNEMLHLLKNARLLISQEGGIPILRHFISKKTSCVIFGPTDKNFYGFNENINLSPDLACECEWVTESWNQYCTKTNSKNSCTANVSPETVILHLKSKNII